VIPEDAIEAAGTDKPRRIMYPHFSTAKIHSDYVDKCVRRDRPGLCSILTNAFSCRVAFHGDYIISKSANENIIVLWMIQNFSSKNPPPPLDAAPTTHEYRDTRSAFGGTFERILQFSSPGTDPFFMRFGFFAEPFMHPMLAIGTWEGKILLWDLKVIEQKGAGPGPEFAKRDSSTPSEKGTPLTGGGKLGRRDDISGLFGKVAAHTTRMLPKKIPIRYISWSPNGEYMVAVAHQSTIFILKRW
jgi:polycomb protein EED